jgi:hypothetical protein
MAIMTGVQSPQVLGASTEEQVMKSKQSMQDVEGGFDSTDRAGDSFGDATDTGTTDGGNPELEQENGLDVIR